MSQVRGFRIWVQTFLTRAGLTIISEPIESNQWSCHESGGTSHENWSSVCFLTGELMEESFGEITLNVDLD